MKNSQRKIINLKGKVAIVVGGSGQMGHETIKTLLAQGVKTVNVDLYEKKIKNINYFFYKVDITNEEEIIKFKIFFLKKYRKLNILINHSHYKGSSRQLDPNNIFFNKLDNYPSEFWKKTLDVNLNGLFYFTKHFIKILIRNKQSVILNTSSTYGKVSPNKNIYGNSGINSPISYATSKFAIIGFTKYIATHYADKGLRANILVPGGIENINHNKVFKKNYSKLTPMGRLAKKNEYNEAILFLVSDASSYMTGSEMIIDGGWTSW
jgi:NAD(P)-dependent dehydrogenase (short-subunit alcohol dehydrogenase family)